MALSGALTAHIESILDNVATTLAASTDDADVRDRPRVNLHDALCRAVAEAVAAEDLSDLTGM